MVRVCGPPVLLSLHYVSGDGGGDAASSEDSDVRSEVCVFPAREIGLVLLPSSCFIVSGFGVVSDA